ALGQQALPQNNKSADEQLASKSSLGKRADRKSDNSLAVSSKPLSSFLKWEFFEVSLSHQTVLFLAVFFFVLSILILRQPMLRYTLPAAVLLVFPTANSLWKM